MAEGKVAKTSGRAWGVFAIIFAYSITVCMFWFSVTAPSIKFVLVAGVFGGNLHTIGTVMSAISLTALIMAFPAGALIRKFGSRVIIMVSMVFSILGCVIAALAGANFALYITGRIVAGIGVGLCGVSCTTLTSLWFSDKAKGLALAIWGIWVPVGMVIVYNVSGPIIEGITGISQATFVAFSFLKAGADQVTATLGAVDMIFWGMAALFVIELILTFIVVRDPSEDEATEVSTERKSYKQIMPVIKQHQLWALCIAWLAFNFCNYAFTSYMSNWFQWAGWSWSSNSGMVTLWSSIASACGIIAPFFGIVYDRIQKYKKWIMVAFGALCITLMCVFGFKQGGEYFFWLYLLFQVLGNCIMIASVRPYIPLLMGRGGATAVSFGFALVTFLQQLGNTLSGVGYASIAGAMSSTPGTIDIVGLAGASWAILVPVGVIGFIATLFIRLPKQQGKGGQPAGKPEGKPEA